MENESASSSSEDEDREGRREGREGDGDDEEAKDDDDKEADNGEDGSLDNKNGLDSALGGAGGDLVCDPNEKDEGIDTDLKEDSEINNLGWFVEREGGWL